MPQIAEILTLPDGRLAVVIPTPTEDEGSITLWTGEEREREIRSAVMAEREECAEIAEARASEGEHGTWQAQEGLIIAAAIRERV